MFLKNQMVMTMDAYLEIIGTILPHGFMVCLTLHLTKDNKMSTPVTWGLEIENNGRRRVELLPLGQGKLSHEK